MEGKITDKKWKKWRERCQVEKDGEKVTILGRCGGRKKILRGKGWRKKCV